MAERGPGITAAAGFPFRGQPVAVPGYKLSVGETIIGNDLEECSGSVVPGKCAFRSPLDAADICAPIVSCRAVAVYPNGTDGCSTPVAILKDSGATATNSAVGPELYLLENVDPELLVRGAGRVCHAPRRGLSGLYCRSARCVYPADRLLHASRTGSRRATPALHPTANPSHCMQRDQYLYNDEVQVAFPTDAELAAAGVQPSDPFLPNSTTWLGCVWAERALMDGQVEELVSNVTSAVACCRRCRATPGANVWNFCDQPGGCRWVLLGCSLCTFLSSSYLAGAPQPSRPAPSPPPLARMQLLQPADQHQPGAGPV